jgi:flagellar protein FlaG
MEIGSVKALAPVSAVLQSTNEPGNSTASGAMDPAAALTFAQPREPALHFDMDAIASELQNFLNSSQRDVEFRVDADTQVQILTVRDSVTGQVIRQFPNEDVSRVLKNLTAQQGTLLNELV